MKQRRAALKLVGAVKGKSDAPAWPRAVPRPKSLPVEAPPTPPAVGESCLLVYEAEEDLVEVLLKDLESLERRRQTEFEDRNRDYEIELESARRVVGAHKAKVIGAVSSDSLPLSFLFLPLSISPALFPRAT